MKMRIGSNRDFFDFCRLGGGDEEQQRALAQPDGSHRSELDGVWAPQRWGAPFPAAATAGPTLCSRCR